MSENKDDFMRARLLECLLVRICGSLFYGDFKAETANEKEWFSVLNHLGLFPESEDHYLKLVDEFCAGFKGYDELI